MKIKEKIIELLRSIMLFLMFCSPVFAIIYYDQNYKTQEKIAEEEKIKYINKLEKIKERLCNKKLESGKITDEEFKICIIRKKYN
jgi:hypothetical protein